MLRLALIGCGNMGGSHRKAMDSLAGRARFVAAVDPDAEKAAAAAEALGCDLAGSSFEDVIESVTKCLEANVKGYKDKRKQWE